MDFLYNFKDDEEAIKYFANPFLTPTQQNDFINWFESTHQSKEDLKKMEIYSLECPCYKCAHQEVCRLWDQIR